MLMGIWPHWKAVTISGAKGLSGYHWWVSYACSPGCDSYKTQEITAQAITLRTSWYQSDESHCPNIDSDIEMTIKSCVPCMEAQKNPLQIMDSNWTYPAKPWSRVHVDFTSPINGQRFLVGLDALSKWPDIFPMKNIDTFSTINILKRLFSQYVLPEILVSDNGTQFTSE